MANDCYVKTLKGGEYNDALLKIGEMRLKVTEKTITSADQQSLSIAGANFDIDVIGNGYFTEGSDPTHLTHLSFTTSTTKNLTFSNGNYEISISNKYNVVRLVNANVENSIFCGNIDYLAYSSDLNRLSLTKNIETAGNLESLSDLTHLIILRLEKTSVIGDIKHVKNNTGLTEIRLGGTDIDGDISNFAAMTGLQDLDISGSKIRGNIESLAACTALRTRVQVNCPNISGDVKTLVHAWLTAATNPKTSPGYIYFAVNPKCTFDGVAIGRVSIKVSWTDADHITYENA